MLNQDYTATCLWMIGKTLQGKDWPLQPYVELAYPSKARVDSRTADEIKADIIKGLLA